MKTKQITASCNLIIKTKTNPENSLSVQRWKIGHTNYDIYLKSMTR